MKYDLNFDKKRSTISKACRKTCISASCSLCILQTCSSPDVDVIYECYPNKDDESIVFANENTHCFSKQVGENRKGHLCSKQVKKSL